MTLLILIKLVELRHLVCFSVNRMHAVINDNGIRMYNLFVEMNTTITSRLRNLIRGFKYFE